MYKPIILMKHILLYILLFTGLAGFCQVPGYMGLKFSVNYDAGLMHPIIVGRTGTLPMLYHNVSVDYVVTRSVSIGVKYCFMTYNAPAEVGQFEGSDFNNQDYKGRYTQHTVAFMVKRFFRNRGFIAPVGRYMSFGLYYQYATDRSATTFVNGNNAVYDHSPAPTGFKGTANYGGFILGVGRNFIVANRMIIDFGGNINVPLSYIIGPELSTEKGTVFRDVVLRNLLQVHLGLGVLAF